jgi:TRAP-type C4-dicarboxylate transport system permease small subunit
VTTPRFQAETDLSASPGFAARLERLGTALENAALVILLGALMLLAVAQIVLRLFFSFGFVWADELVKLFVMWIALIASIAASRSDRHLRIDMLSHFAPEKFARFPRIVVDAFAAFMCGVLAWHSWRYVQLTIDFDDTVLINTPAWLAYILLPLSFVLMSYRFVLTTISEIMKVLQSTAATEDGQ